VDVIAKEDGSVGVKTVAVIGAGTMGRGIAYAAALGGYNTVLEDVLRSRVEEGVAWIRRSLEESVARGKVQASVREKALSLVTTANTVEDAIHDAELIIEAVPEELEMKLELFTIFDKFAKTGAIFASSSTSLSITDFADIAVSRERCIGMQFFHPVAEMKLVEIIRTPYTSEHTVAVCSEVARRMGKDVVVQEGRLGRKVEHGVYDYREHKAAEKSA